MRANVAVYMRFQGGKNTIFRMMDVVPVVGDVIELDEEPNTELGGTMKLKKYEFRVLERRLKPEAPTRVELVLGWES